MKLQILYLSDLHIKDETTLPESRITDIIDCLKTEKDIENDTEGDSLSELVNSEDYINYTPEEDKEDSTEALKALFTEVFGQIAEDDSEDEGTSAEGQENGNAQEIRAEGAEEAPFFVLK